MWGFDDASGIVRFMQMSMEYSMWFLQHPFWDHAAVRAILVLILVAWVIATLSMIRRYRPTLIGLVNRSVGKVKDYFEGKKMDRRRREEVKILMANEMSLLIEDLVDNDKLSRDEATDTYKRLMHHYPLMKRPFIEDTMKNAKRMEPVPPTFVEKLLSKFRTEKEEHPSKQLAKMLRAKA